MTLLSARVFRLNARTCVWHCETSERLRTIDSRWAAWAGTRASNRLAAVTPSRFRFSISKAAILARCDLPEPK